MHAMMKRSGVVSLQPFTIVIATTIFARVYAFNFYCPDAPKQINLAQGEQASIITRYRGQSFYSESQYCEWHVDAGLGQRVHVEVAQSDLQYAQPGSLCDGFDSVKIVDDLENLVLVSWCGNEHPDVINTEGHQLKIVFSSDSITPSTERYTRGVTLTLKAFASSECPPDWQRLESSCFKRQTSKASWFESQEGCNLEQGNLASIKSQEEFDFIRTYFNATGKVWIGLSDIASPTTFEWIDKVISTSYNGVSTLTPNKFSHCVSLNVKSEELSTEDCEGKKYESLCRANRGPPFTIYPLPREGTNKGSGSSGRLLLLGLLVPAAILLLLVIIGIIVYQKRKSLPWPFSTDTFGKRSAGATSASVELSGTTVPEARSSFNEISDQEASQHVAPPTYLQAISDPRVL
ncbi:uncharacterized protein LOC101852709 [Aplysia californica]|uniref:Uncharacterized protein LOC101852709 n=1 Tax=Aplysia californica TaxID=6500 RepID=A0ABM0JWY7_APLCA|nr:uncharacterized protein LOC101852709 [Aplysia californica]